MKKLLVSLFALFIQSDLALAAPSISHAWIPEVPPVSSVMAGFMVLQNPDAGDIRVVSVQSPQFGEVQMHLSVEENGVARMLPQKELVIPAGGQLELKSGSYHLMLFSPVKPLKAGDQVTLHFQLSDGQKLTVSAEVKKTGGMKEKREASQMKCAAGKCGR